MSFQLNRLKIFSRDRTAIIGIGISVVLLLSNIAFADYRLGASAGLGGTGLTTDTLLSDNTTATISRGDSPGIFALSVEYLLSDISSLSIDHTRGIYLSPFSSGIGFSGITWRRYFYGYLPSVVNSQNDNSLLLITRRSFFLGASAGLAEGTIRRPNTSIPSISSSGIYYGFRAGYDYQNNPGETFRWELLYANTFPSADGYNTSLTAFAIQFGILLAY